MPSAHASTDGESEPRLDQVCLRLVNRELLGEELLGSCSYARPVVGDLVELLALPAGRTPPASSRAGRKPPASSRAGRTPRGDLPAVYLRDDDVERLGADALRAAALENLLCAPLGRAKVIEWPYGLKVHEVWHPVRTHTASKVLVLRDVLRRVLGRDDFPHGVLVIVPTSYDLAFLPIEACQALGAVPPLAAYARAAFEEDPGALTPEVLWWRDGVLRTVSDEEDGLDPDFSAMMLRVAEEERDRELGGRP